MKSFLAPLDCKVNPASDHATDHAGKKMKNLVRIHMFPPRFEPNMPQMMSLKKLNESRWRWRAPQFVGQTQTAKECEENDQSVRENAYLHL